DDDAVERHPVGVTGGAGQERDVDGGTGRTTLDVGDRALVRIEGPLVDGDVEDALVLEEHLLCPVAVMDVPVDDGHGLAPGTDAGGGHGDVVEGTEPHRPGAKGVVARRPGDGEAG